MTWLARPCRVLPTAVLVLAALAVPSVLLAGCVGQQRERLPPAKPLSASVSGPVDTGPRGPSELAPFYGQKVTWNDCGEGFQCASVTVPVDWAQPSGATIKLALKRLPAAGTKIGSMLINPGGPGVSGLSFVDPSPERSSASAVRNTFDVVGWDPRGVGESAPVDCFDRAQVDRYVAMDATPDTPAEVSDLGGCVARTSPQPASGTPARCWPTSTR